MAEKKAPGELMDWQIKQREFEQVKARAKNAKLRTTCTICGEKAKLNCPCGTTQCAPGAANGSGAPRSRRASRPGRRHRRPGRYCTTECQRIDWRDRGHRKACKKIRNERAADAARAEAPTPPPSPPEEVVYGPAPRSHADEVRARIAAEHEAARVRREANPEPEPVHGAVFGSRCPICFEDWDVNVKPVLRFCCCRLICKSCEERLPADIQCPLCRTPAPRDRAEHLARLRRHAENDQPQAIFQLAIFYRNGAPEYLIVKNSKKAAKIAKRGVEVGGADSMVLLGGLYTKGEGVKLDRKKSMQLFRMAADRGHPKAQILAGIMLRDSEKFDEAFHYFKLSAEQGFNYGQRVLGDAYINGQGVAQDPLEGMRWYERAAAKGDQKAVDVLAKVKTKEDELRVCAADGDEDAIALLAKVSR